jgi:hypothetical protein
MNEQLKELIQTGIRSISDSNERWIFVRNESRRRPLGSPRQELMSLLHDDPRTAIGKQLAANPKPQTLIIFPLATDPMAPNVAGRPKVWHQNGTFGV